MTFQDFALDYKCDEKTNNYIYRHFTEMTHADAFLMNHRIYVETKRLGFGDRAFHYMWLLLLEHLFEKNGFVRLLEIGVYKGQVISLWALIAKKLKSECEISCITPLSGNASPKNGFLFFWKYFTSKTFRACLRSGNAYDNDNYLHSIDSLFKRFELNFDKVRLYKGLSSDERILSELKDTQFDLIYIDGDHTKEAVEMDIRNYAPKVKVSGFLIMDDAACNIPGGEHNAYWKGHQSVSDACASIAAFGFENVLNVGHNRIFQRTK